jgi:hypothetical protein
MQAGLALAVLGFLRFGMGLLCMWRGIGRRPARAFGLPEPCDQQGRCADSRITQDCRPKRCTDKDQRYGCEQSHPDGKKQNTKHKTLWDHLKAEHQSNQGFGAIKAPKALNFSEFQGDLLFAKRKRRANDCAALWCCIG